MQGNTFGAFAASSIERVVAYRTISGNGMSRPSGQIVIDRIDYGACAAGQFNWHESSPPSSPWPSGGLPRHPSSWRSPDAHCASCRLRARRPIGGLLQSLDIPGQFPGVHLRCLSPPPLSLSAIPHSSPSSTPISITSSILLKPAYMMHTSSCAEKARPGEQPAGHASPWGR